MGGGECTPEQGWGGMPDVAPSQSFPGSYTLMRFFCGPLCRLIKQFVALKCLGTMGRVGLQIPYTLLGTVCQCGWLHLLMLQEVHDQWKVIIRGRILWLGAHWTGGWGGGGVLHAHSRDPEDTPLPGVPTQDFSVLVFPIPLAYDFAFCLFCNQVCVPRIQQRFCFH